MKKLSMWCGVIVSLGATTALAQPQQNGLVNVNITDVTIQIPVAVAANVCGVSVNVLADTLAQGPVACQSGSISLAQSPGGGNGSSPRQQGLVNVNIQDVTAQVPVSVAANVCGVAVNVLVSALGVGPVDCTANGIATVTP